MQIAIPSKARPFRSKTKDLLTCGIMYVPESEVQEYKKIYSEVVGVPNEVRGITATRNWILRNCGERDVVFVDDDVRNAGRFVLNAGGGKLERCKMSEEEWMREFERLFELTDSFGWKIFGVNTESSRWSCHVGHPFQLRGYVLASCMGIINDGTLYFDESFRVKEDYEISLRHVQQFGGIVRAEYMYFENEHWTGDGGCKDYRTDELERDCINRLIQLYPRFIRNVSNKSSQYTIKLHFD